MASSTAPPSTRPEATTNRARGDDELWRAQLARDGFCLVDVCSAAQATEWKAAVQTLQRRRQAGQTVVDPSTQSVVDPSETGIEVWMVEEEEAEEESGAGGFPAFFLRQLAHPVLVRSAAAFFPCEHHVQPSATASTSVQVELLSCKPVLKSKKVSHPSPWHQDYVYWGGAPKVSAWVALDDATLDNGCLRVVPGSHRWGLVPHEKFQERLGFDNRIPDAEVARLVRARGARVVDVPVPAGSAIVFSDLLLHCSNPNRTGADRYSLIPTYRQAGAPDQSTVWRRAARYSPLAGAFVLDAEARYTGRAGDEAVDVGARGGKQGTEPGNGGGGRGTRAAL